MLPCIHDTKITNQVQPTIDLLVDMDKLHADVLLGHSIQPEDYKNSLVFRSAVESIRGNFIASSTNAREGFVGAVLRDLKERNQIVAYDHNRSRSRFDFTVQLQQDPDVFAALEVKGGEGNSINISDRERWMSEFGVWSHLDGAVVNQPAHGAQSIVNRITNELVRRGKQVDMLFIKDTLCGTRARPCPKYQGQERDIGLKGAPDVFLFPTQRPSPNNPRPPTHTLESLIMPKLILDCFDVPRKRYSEHVWEVSVEWIELSENRARRHIQVRHQGKQIGESTSRAWRVEREGL